MLADASMDVLSNELCLTAHGKLVENLALQQYDRVVSALWSFCARANINAAERTSFYYPHTT